MDELRARRIKKQRTCAESVEGHQLEPTLNGLKCSRCKLEISNKAPGPVARVSRKAVPRKL